MLLETQRIVIIDLVYLGLPLSYLFALYILSAA